MTQLIPFLDCMFTTKGAYILINCTLKNQKFFIYFGTHEKIGTNFPIVLNFSLFDISKN